MIESRPKILVEIEERRAEGKSPGEDNRGLLKRLADTPNATIDDLGTDKVPLRKGDDRDAKVAGVRDNAAKMLRFTVTERPDEVIAEPVAATSNESLEKLSGVERACLEAMREDFDRGIVLIDDDADGDAYRAALDKDKTAGQTWKAIQEKLLANEASLLKKAVELSKLTGDQTGKGALLVGVYENGELAIRQRSQEIVNARWTKNWEDEDGEPDKGELHLLFHPEAMAQETGRWAKAIEILRAVKAAGYHVPAAAPDYYNKKGLVAASEAVTDAHYVMSPDGKEWRRVMLECPDNVADDATVYVVHFNPDVGIANVNDDDARNRNGNRGAVLWLRG